jgi:hypothetical protein
MRYETRMVKSVIEAEQPYDKALRRYIFAQLQFYIVPVDPVYPASGGTGHFRSTKPLKFMKLY